MARRAGCIDNRSGFTLIEIMTVVFVISIILMIAVPSWMRARKNAEAKSCVSQLRQIEYAKGAWAIEFNMNQTQTPDWDNLAGYLKHQPICPAGGTYTIGYVSIDPTCSIGGTHVLL